jgi:hypothetical protein
VRRLFAVDVVSLSLNNAPTSVIAALRAQLKL